MSDDLAPARGCLTGVVLGIALLVIIVTIVGMIAELTH